MRFTDETPPLPTDAPVVGPVVAVLAAPAASFRARVGPVVIRVVPGTLADHRFAACAGRTAFALVFVVVASTPLDTALALLR